MAKYWNLTCWNVHFFSLLSSSLAVVTVSAAMVPFSGSFALRTKLLLLVSVIFFLFLYRLRKRVRKKTDIKLRALKLFARVWNVNCVARCWGASVRFLLANKCLTNEVHLSITFIFIFFGKRRVVVASGAAVPPRNQTDVQCDFVNNNNNNDVDVKQLMMMTKMSRMLRAQPDDTFFF